MKRKHLGLITTLALLALAQLGCAVVVRGSALSSRPHEDNGFYLSTGDADRPYTTVGFIQVRGYGVEVAGLADVGDHAIDGAIKGALSDKAREMGGDGVIFIDFLDENPSTPAERAQAAAETASSFSQGQGEVKTKDRYVRVTGQVIKFRGSQP